MNADARVIGVCMDDVGLVGGVAEAAVRLAAGRRVSAATCVTTALAWPSEGAAVAAAASDALELGLHLNLTEGPPLSHDLAAVWPELPPLRTLLAAAHVGRLPLAAIGVELRAQFDAFADVVGRPPDFIDGHQHVHHLPGVRRLVVDAAVEGGRPGEAIAVRNTGRVCGPGNPLKRFIIERSGGRALSRLLASRGVPTNSALLGVYDFHARDYRALLRGWLAAAPDEGGLLVCHPRIGPVDAREPISAARSREFAYLASDTVVDDLAAAGFVIGPSWLPAPARSSSGDSPRR